MYHSELGQVFAHTLVFVEPRFYYSWDVKEVSQCDQAEEASSRGRGESGGDAESEWESVCERETATAHTHTHTHTRARARATHKHTDIHTTRCLARSLRMC